MSDETVAGCVAVFVTALKAPVYVLVVWALCKYVGCVS